jgi:hypothetical protein
MVKAKYLKKPATVPLCSNKSHTYSILFAALGNHVNKAGFHDE